MKEKIILMVEDDELDVISVQRCLKKMDLNYKLLTAYNGKEALRILKDSTAPIIPDVILLDLSMPKMNGIELLTTIRKDDTLKNIKVFIMTISADRMDRNVAEELGISGYIIKPLEYTDNSKRSDSMDAFVQFHLRKILM